MGKAVRQGELSTELSLKKGKLSGSEAMKRALSKAQEARLRLVEQQQAERAERVSVARRLDEVAEQATASGEEVERTQAGAVHVVSRDGLLWAFRKGHLDRAHYDAGVKFQGDWQLAHGTGVTSCLAAEGGGAFGPKSGPTDAMLKARDQAKAALKALGTPMLEVYVVRIAGEGEMLSGPAFCKDSRRVGEHVLPCRIAFDLLARHYGLIR